eukprot:CAMPEP_0119302388 /NCGR_PEP_ID=MMETSP1333-20130426/3985_1 /TAXON_ID=418940 /ORGANISM="Scyphosphaera apsteinii, Strain RCC1455" /LENGTH=43 /DNA_ID= /DNA_START= /DNA_END= /DNA_ORIENTATION=
MAQLFEQAAAAAAAAAISVQKARCALRASGIASPQILLAWAEA